MQPVSAAFAEAMENTPYIARVTLDGIDTIQGDAIRKVDVSGGANASESGLALGAAVAGSATILVDKDGIGVILEDRQVFLEFGIEINSQMQWIPMGTYTVTDVSEDDGLFTVKCNDALSAKFDRDYEPIEGFDFDADSGVDSCAFLAALSARRGITVDTSNLDAIQLKGSPAGYTERQIIGYISAMYGGFANISRLGVLRVMKYTDTDLKVDPDHYYAGEMEKTSFDYVASWIKCYVEPLAETLTLGDASAAQGIYFECPWMTIDRLTQIWEQLQGFSYRPIRNLKFLGDPRIDPGDRITLQALDGATHLVPVMTISHSWDGGIVTQLSASGEARTKYYEGPVKREAKRLYTNILKKQNEIQLEVRKLDGKEIISRINLTDTTARIQASNIKFEGLVTANNNFKILDDGSIETVNGKFSGTVNATGGKIGGCEIIDGVLKVPFVNITGTITAGKILVKDASGATLLSAGDNAVQIAGWEADTNSLYSGDTFSTANCFLCTGSSASMSIGGSESISGWMIKAGSKFGVTKDGVAYMNDAHVTGEVTAKSGKIGGWDIKGNKMCAGDGSTIKVVAIQAPTATNSFVFAAGGTSHDSYADCPFRVTKAGKLFAAGVEISGKIDAEEGTISGWNISTYTTDDDSVDYYSGPALIAEQTGSASFKVALTPIGVYYSYYNGTKTVTTYASWATMVTTTAAAAAAALAAEET